MRLIPRILGLLLCIVPFASALAAPYSQVKMEYEIYTRGFTVAEVNESYTTTADNRYRLTSQQRMVGVAKAIKAEIVDVVSEGTVTPNGLRPDRFSSVRKVDTDRNASASFDWVNKIATLINVDGTQKVPLPPDTQDRASAMYQFMFLSLENATRLDFHMMNVNKLDIYNYTVQPGGRVKVPAGTFDTIYVVSLPEAGKKNKTELWIARERGWLVCKMIITDGDGSRYTQELTKFEAR
jgi:hypothetical protein